MANTTINIPKPHLIMGLCLPLAVLIGYLLAEPLESGSLAVVIFVFSVLAVPILLKWHHSLLVIFWNATINPFFLPGRPYLWMILAMISLLLAVLNRATDPHFRFILVPSVTRPLLIFFGVVILTCMITGGFGLRVFGSSTYGGRNYIYLVIGIAGYFALCSKRIPLESASFFVGLFFLAGVTSIVSNLAFLGGSGFYFLYQLFPPEFALDQASAGDSVMDNPMVRLSGLTWAAQAIYCFLLARYGVKGIFNLASPWRLVIFAGTLFASLFGGYRSALILMGMTFIILFSVEKLWRTGLMVVLLVGTVLAGTGLVLFASKLPLSVQRSLSFLPIHVDQIARDSAIASTEWRLQMWRRVLPELPQYLLKGKGYALDPNELFMASHSRLGGSEEGAMYAGDYHNGPLSVLMPFGLFGTLALLWFFYRGTGLLHHYCRFGDPALSRINAFLFALFLARILSFLLISGSIYSDLFSFTGLLGLSVSLNGRPGLPSVSEEAAATQDDLVLLRERSY